MDQQNSYMIEIKDTTEDAARVIAFVSGAISTAPFDALEREGAVIVLDSLILKLQSCSDELGKLLKLESTPN